MKQTKIVSAFPCCGKTHSLEHNNDPSISICDSDSSLFSWILDSNNETTPERNSAFPSNYIAHIKQCIGKYDVIFVSSHAEVRQALYDAGLNFVVVAPDKSCKSEWVSRASKRVGHPLSASLMNNMYNSWIQSIEEFSQEFSVPVHTLYSGEYIDIKSILSGEGIFRCSLNVCAGGDTL